MVQEPPLQPLRIPTGWRVIYNDWTEVDPEMNGALEHLTEDLLQLKNADRNLLIDVGWYGEGQSACFGAVVHRGDFNGVLLAEFSSRSRPAVVKVVEDWLQRRWTSTGHTSVSEQSDA